MRRLVATAALVTAVALAGCDGSRLARTDQQEPAGTASTITPDTGPAAAEPPADDPPADDPPAADPPADDPTEVLTDEQVSEIETALIDAEAMLASIEAELAQDE